MKKQKILARRATAAISKIGWPRRDSERSGRNRFTTPICRNNSTPQESNAACHGVRFSAAQRACTGALSPPFMHNALSRRRRRRRGRRGRRRRRERMREHRPPRVISLHKDGITLGDPSREGKRERERDLLSQKGKPREARLLEFTRFDACLRVSPGFRQRALEDISAWVGRVYPAQARSATVDWRRSGEPAFRWTIALDSHGPWRYSTFFGCLYRGLDEKERKARELFDTRPRDICIEVSARGAFCSAIHGGAKRFYRGTKMGNGNGKRSQSMRVCR